MGACVVIAVGGLLLGRLGLLEARHRALAEAGCRRAGALSGSGAIDPAGSIAVWTRRPRLRRAGRDPPRRRGTSCSRRPTTRCARRPSASRPPRPSSCPVVVIGWLVLGQPAIPPQAWAHRHPVRRRRGPVLRVPRRGVPARRPVGRLPAGARHRPAARDRDRHHAARGATRRRARGSASGCCSRACSFVQRPWRLLRSATSANDRSAAGFALLTGATIATYSALDRVGRLS